MVVSVIIPTFNRPGSLAQCLGALASSRLPAESREVIVVDDGGAENLEPIVSRFQARLIRQTHAGPSAARNRGAAAARGDVLAFTDDDCRPSPEWLPVLVDSTRRHPGSLLGGRTENDLPDNIFSEASQQLIDYLYDYLHRNPRDLQVAALTPFFASNNFAVARSQFHEIGGFNTSFPDAGAEDREFCYRWLRQGWPLQHVPEALIYHGHHLHLASFWRQHHSYGRGGRRFRTLRAKDSRLIPWEPYSFYVSMIQHPLREGVNGRNLRLAALLGLSQAATLAGFLRQSMEPAR